MRKNKAINKVIDGWEDNAIQFPRLIAEAQAAGAFTEKVLQDMSESMDLEWGDILSIISRAEEEFEEIKNKLT